MTWPLKMIKITGHSMEPAIANGNFLLVNQWSYILRKPHIGEIVIYRNPQNEKQLFCKRIAAIRDDRYIVLGDNPHDSLDSRMSGPITSESIIGRMIA